MGQFGVITDGAGVGVVFDGLGDEDTKKRRKNGDTPATLFYSLLIKKVVCAP